MDDQTGASGPAGSEGASPAAQLERMRGELELWTGDHIYVRPIRPDDTERLQEFHSRLSSTAIMFRFFRYVPALSQADAEHFTHLDYQDRMALVATSDAGSESPLLGVVRYERVSADTAEAAFVVEDHWQGHGIATALLRWLAPYARARGITRFLAITLATNAKMLEVLQNAGYPHNSRYSDGEFEITLDIGAPAEGEPRLSP